MKQPSQTLPFKVNRRCAFKSTRLSKCKKLQKTCDAPSEYSFCSSYQPTPADSKLTLPPLQQQPSNIKGPDYSPRTLFIGIKTGRCDICKVTKKTLLLKFGVCLCEECLSVCAIILEELLLDDTKPKIFVGSEKISSSKTKTQKGPYHANNF